MEERLDPEAELVKAMEQKRQAQQILDMARRATAPLRARTRLFVERDSENHYGEGLTELFRMHRESA